MRDANNSAAFGSALDCGGRSGGAGTVGSAARLGGAAGESDARLGAAGPASMDASERSSGTGDGSPACSAAAMSGDVALPRRERRFVRLLTALGRSSGRGDSVISVCAADEAPACRTQVIVS